MEVNETSAVTQSTDTTSDLAAAPVSSVVSPIIVPNTGWTAADPAA